MGLERWFLMQYKEKSQRGGVDASFVCEPWVLSDHHALFVCRHCASFMHGLDGCPRRLRTCSVDHESTQIDGTRPSRLCTRGSFRPRLRAQCRRRLKKFYEIEQWRFGDHRIQTFTAFSPGTSCADPATSSNPNITSILLNAIWKGYEHVERRMRMLLRLHKSVK